MHKSDVIVLGSKTFISTLNELLPYLKFKISPVNVNNLKKSISINKLLLCDNEFLDNKNNIDLIKNSECIKILASSLSGIAIFTGILLILEKRVITGNMSIEKLFEMTRVVCIVTAAISFGGAIVTYLMTIGKKTSQTKEFAEAKTAAENTAADAEMEAAIAASMASDTVGEASSNVPDSVQEGVANASSTVEDSGITST